MTIPANDNNLSIDARLLLETFDLLELARSLGYTDDELVNAIGSMHSGVSREQIRRAVGHAMESGFVVRLPSGRVILERRITSTQLGFVRELISVLARSA